MFDSARSVISTALAVAAALLVLLVIGIVTHPGATGMAAVGDGIGAVISGAISLISHVRF